MKGRPHIRLYTPRRKVGDSYGEAFEGRLDISGSTFMNCMFKDCDLYAETPARFYGAIVTGKVRISGVWHCPIFGMGGPTCGCADCTAVYQPLLLAAEGRGGAFFPGSTAVGDAIMGMGT